MAVTFRDYTAEQVEAARSVLLELFCLSCRVCWGNIARTS